MNLYMICLIISIGVSFLSIIDNKINSRNRETNDYIKIFIGSCILSCTGVYAYENYFTTKSESSSIKNFIQLNDVVEPVIDTTKTIKEVEVSPQAQQGVDIVEGDNIDTGLPGF